MKQMTHLAAICLNTGCAVIGEMHSGSPLAVEIVSWLKPQEKDYSG